MPCPSSPPGVAEHQPTAMGYQKQQKTTAR